MYVKFQTEKKGINKLLKNKKSYSLMEADEKLKEFARTLPETKKPNLMMIEIFEDNEEDIFRSEFIAGTDDSSNLLLLIDDLLKTEFSDVAHEESSELLQKITKAFFKEKDGKPDQEEIETDEAKAVDVSKPLIEKKKNIVLKNKSKENKKKIKAGKKSVSHGTGFLFNKKIIICILIFFVSISSVGITTYLTKSLNNKPAESYSELFKQERYSEIMAEYPEDEKRLVEELYSQENSKGLEELVNTNHSKLASFYLNFRQENWKKVTNEKGIDQDSTIQAMRGYAYLKQDKLEEAELINQVLKNDTLSEQINLKKKKIAYQNLHDQKISSAENINKEIQDSELTDDIKVAKSIVNLLKKYQKDKNDSDLSEAERNEAKNNYDQWEDNLKQLGGRNQ